jgi:hypothetical protein
MHLMRRRIHASHSGNSCRVVSSCERVSREHIVIEGTFYRERSLIGVVRAPDERACLSWHIIRL